MAVPPPALLIPVRSKSKGRRLPQAPNAATNKPINHHVDDQQYRQQQDLHFVHLTGSNLRQRRTATDQKVVRAHVMRSYLRHREDPPFQPRAKDVPSSLGEHVGRFRAGPSLATSQRKPRSRKPSTWHYLDDDDHDDDDDQPVRAIVPRTRHQSASTPDQLLNHYLEHPFSNPLAATVPGTPDLLEYYHTRYWDNSSAVNPEGEWLAVALTDPATFHATMCLVALHRCGLYGPQHRYAYFAHRGEAIKIITAQLADPEARLRLSDSTIGAVSVLGSADNNAHQSRLVQDSHLAGLMTMIEARGGIDALTSNRHVKRVASWADIFHAATHNTRPRLALSSCAVHRNVAPLLQLTCHRQRDTTLLDQDEIPPHVSKVLDSIRLLGQAKTLLASIDRRRDATLPQIYSSVLYLTERAILEWEAADQMRPLRLLETEAGIQAMKAATLIFTYRAFRDMAVPAQFFDKFIARLRMNMEMVVDSVCLPGGTEFELCLLLWWCLCGWKVTAGVEGRRRERRWFAKVAQKVSDVAGVGELDGFRDCLGRVMVLERCHEAVEGLWGELQMERYLA